MKYILAAVFLFASIEAFAVTAYLETCEVRLSASGAKNVWFGVYSYGDRRFTATFSINRGYWPGSIELD